MEVKIYVRAKEHPAAQLLESITKDTDLVKVQASDYESEPIVRQLDFEDRILGDKEAIMSNAKKLVGIIDIELWMKNHMWEVVRPGDIVEFEGNRFIKGNNVYVPVEIKN